MLETFETIEVNFYLIVSYARLLMEAIGLVIIQLTGRMNLSSST